MIQDFSVHETKVLRGLKVLCDFDRKFKSPISGREREERAQSASSA